MEDYMREELKQINKKMNRIDGMLKILSKEIEQVEMDTRFLQIEIDADEKFNRWSGNV